MVVLLARMKFRPGEGGDQSPYNRTSPAVLLDGPVGEDAESRASIVAIRRLFAVWP